MTDWLPSKSDYEKDAQVHADRAKSQLDAIQAQLDGQRTRLEEHGLSYHRNGQHIEVKRGPLDLVSISCNFDNRGATRIVDQIASYLQLPDSNFDVPVGTDPTEPFKAKLKSALDRFYENKGLFQALGLV